MVNTSLLENVLKIHAIWLLQSEMSLLMFASQRRSLEIRTPRYEELGTAVTNQPMFEKSVFFVVGWWEVDRMFIGHSCFRKSHLK